MLPKINRLTKDKDFERVFKRSRSYYSEILGVKAAANGLEVSRIGILVGTKVSKKAVVRNSARRKIREAARIYNAELKKGYDIVIIALPAIKDKTMQEIKQSLRSSLRRIGVI